MTKPARLLSRPWTDSGSAERLVDRHGADLRYVDPFGYYVYDGSRWLQDDTGEVHRRAKSVAREFHREAADLRSEEERRNAIKFALACESARSLRNAIELAKNDERIRIRPARLDADPFLLNVNNGTLDLRTGRLRSHQRKDLLTKFVPVEYLPRARSEVWDSFLRQVTGGDEALQGFLQRAVGYSLTGLTVEEVLFFLHGPTATGKSSFIEAVTRVFGSYGRVADFETLLAGRDGGIRNDIARLVGARMVVSQEADPGRRFAESLLKTLTGGDTIAARFLFKETFEYTPQLKLWLIANDRPGLSSTDDAIWRRMLLVPFVQTIPREQRDKGLKQRLREPDTQSAILAWAVKGGRDWQRIGLDPPASVRAYTDEYRAENDPFRDWLRDDCSLEANAVTSAADLGNSYAAWARRNGVEPVSRNELAKSLRSRGCVPGKDRSGRFWRGIALLNCSGVTR